MARTSLTKFSILGILTLKKRISGYEIKQMMDYGVERIWHASYGQIYPLLKNLEKDGLIRSFQVGQDKKPDKKEYQITKAGKDILDSWLGKVPSLPKSKNEIILKVAFANNYKKEELIKLIQEYKARLEDSLKTHKEHIQMIDRECDVVRFYHPIREIALFMSYKTEAEIKWCEENIEKIRKKQIYDEKDINS